MANKGIFRLLIASALLLLVTISPLISAFNFRREPKKKKRAREGYKKTKDGWIRLDLAPDSMLRIGVMHRPRDCP
jgi:hypothetical protein